MSEASPVDFPATPHPWQKTVWQRLQEQHSAGKLPHGMMFAGPKGIGKRHLSNAFGQFVLCLSPSNGVACGACKSCDLIRVDTHPDLFVLEPEQTGKAIKIDQVRQLAEFVAKTSQQGGYKVVVIDPAEAMNPNAANALLKSLEEPAGNTLLMLISHVPSSVMATIRSRCQLLSLATPGRAEALPWLEQTVAGTAEAAQLLDIASGAPLAALALLEGDALERRQTLMTDFEAVSLGQASPLEVASRWMAFEPLAVVEWLLKSLHGFSRYLGAPGLDATVEGVPAGLMPLLSGVDQIHLYRYIDKTMAVKRQLIGGANPNKQLLLEELLMDWSALARLAARGGQRQRNGLS